MIPLDVFGSEAVAANLLQQVRWCDGVTCPRCRSDRTVRNGSYRSFNGICVRIATARSTIRRARFSLTRRLHSVCGCSRFMRFSGLTRVSANYSTKWSDTQNGPPAHRVLHQSTRCALDLVGPVEIDEVYVSAGKKGRERDQESRSRGLSTRGRGTYDGDKPPVFIIADRGTGQRYVILRKPLTNRRFDSCWLTATRSR